MPGFCGIIGFATEKNRSDISSTIDLNGQAEHRSFAGANYYFEVAFRNTDPLKGGRSYEDERQILLFHGDFVDYDTVPWETIAESIRENDYSFFNNLSGIFSFISYDKSDDTVRLISDRRAQDPLFYYKGKDQFIFSTDLSTFCRILEAEFNEKWLYEYYFFNISMAELTPIINVFRVGFAEILTYFGDEVRFEKYADLYRAKEDLISGRESLEYAYRVFADRVPEYYKGSEDIACALTGGWDARTNLAFAPDLDKILAYTYGVPGAADQLIASDFARKTSIRHELIDFDASFVQHLPAFMLKSVFLSSGLNHIGRSSLCFSYEKLSREKNIALIISGIQLDQIFRGHAHVPAMVSNGLFALFRGNRNEPGRYGITKSGEFVNHIEERTSKLASDMGDPRSNLFHLLYHLYINAPNLFAGEIKIADQFCTLRVPAWDNDILNLTFSIAESTLLYSEFGNHKRGDWSEMFLQSYLLNRRRKKFAKIPVGVTSPNWVLKGKRAHIMKSYLNRITNRIKYYPGLGRVPLENNKKWINEDHKDFIEKLVLSESSYVRRYFDDKYLHDIIKSPETHYTMKIATVEILIRLIKNKWRLRDLEEDVLN